MRRLCLPSRQSSLSNRPSWLLLTRKLRPFCKFMVDWWTPPTPCGGATGGATPPDAARHCPATWGGTSGSHPQTTRVLISVVGQSSWLHAPPPAQTDVQTPLSKRLLSVTSTLIYLSLIHAHVHFQFEVLFPFIILAVHVLNGDMCIN